ncbi:MAG: UvrD-helicase domain-containing protein [Gammaproteobacteria bacterium]|nr:UvrD-helicase domain-containing protein [Gammaproteobacteria bacterium]
MSEQQLTTESVADAGQRQQALRPDCSFIVQAPAGSGKTALLVQRILVLLARVEAPEEVVAITFTRKAAAEMRERIVDALRDAAAINAPLSAHEQQTRRLAQAVLQRDQQLDWQICRNPSRLRIQTIDSLCAALTRQMPWLSRFGDQPAVEEDATERYRQAARATLDGLEGEAWSPAMAHLLAHLDNDLPKVEALLMDMLQRRDQWLRHVLGSERSEVQRERLEAVLRSVVVEALQRVHSAFPFTQQEPLLRLASLAAGNLKGLGVDSQILACLDLQQLPGAALEELPQWLGLAELLLTQGGEWRRKLNKKQGILASSSGKTTEEKAQLKAVKEEMSALLDALREEEGLRQALSALNALPAMAYTDQQWQLIEALLELLPMAVAQLRLAFQAQGSVDFSEIAHAALHALGDADAPSDLALALDYRIQHLLVDEFQDTSFGQYQLLERLTAGWQADDGRTLFLVGDPMQSIYRFREADVGLFLWAQEHGIGEVALTSLRLSVNFRSAGGIIDWVNRSFEKVFPVSEDIASGAVSYSDSTAFHVSAEDAAVSVHPYVDCDAAEEGTTVAALIKAALASDAQGSVAVLVRSRPHLIAIIPALREAGINYRAVDIERLGERPLVQDLMVLTRALLHPADRIAWLALLRAPWCGLTLADLLAVAGPADTTIWARMADDAVREALSDEGRARLLRFYSVLDSALQQRRRLPLRCWVEGVWLELGGPACVGASDLADANVYFNLLETLDQGADLSDFAQLQQQVEQLFAHTVADADCRVQLMTIHKSKGLEFDSVIVPALGQRPAAPSSRLLMWAERLADHDSGQQQGELLLAPIRATADAGDDSIAQYLKRVEKKREHYEAQRLLYVAATRAKKHLHLLGRMKSTKTGELSSPSAGSLLAQLWPVVQAQFEATLKQVGQEQTDQVETPPDSSDNPQHERPPQAWMTRLPVSWQLPAASPAVHFALSHTAHLANDSVEFSWAGEQARHVGSVVHYALKIIAEQGVQHWDAQRINAHDACWRALLQHYGVPQQYLDQAVVRTGQALRQALADQRGRWLLSSAHADARCEYALSGVLGTGSAQRVTRVVIDRTFIDEHGVRWIVDYKTGSHEGAALEEFLDEEWQRYHGQLEHYAALMQQFEPQREIMLGLYFPLLEADGWRQWRYAP